MKHYSILFVAAAVIIGASACRKNIEATVPASALANTNTANNSSGSGSGGSNTTGFLQSVISGSASRLISANSDSIWVSFTQASLAGWVLKLSSNDPSVHVPATYAVPQGSFNVHPPVTSSVISSSKSVTITVTLGTETKSTTLKVFPITYNFPAPQLQSPGNGAGFKNRIQVKFTWSDNANAYHHDIQISDNAAFNNTPILEVYTDNPIWAASYFNGLGMRYWRVRYIDASGNFGPWS